jgi:hypothetical protein
MQVSSTRQKPDRRPWDQRARFSNSGASHCAHRKIVEASTSHTALLHHLHQSSIRDAVFAVPANTNQSDLDWERRRLNIG